MAAHGERGEHKPRTEAEYIYTNGKSMAILHVSHRTTQPEPQQWCLSLTFQLFRDSHHRCRGDRNDHAEAQFARHHATAAKIAKSQRRSPDRPAAPLLPSRTTTNCSVREICSPRGSSDILISTRINYATHCYRLVYLVPDTWYFCVPGTRTSKCTSIIQYTSTHTRVLLCLPGQRHDEAWVHELGHTIFKY